MTPFEIELYRLINDTFKGVAHKLTYPQLLLALGKQDAPLADKSTIATLLHDEQFQKVLWQSGLSLWFGRDHKIRVVDTLKMKLRQHVGKGMCRLCLMEEDDAHELRREGEDYVHHLCLDRFLKLQKLAEVSHVE
ncbi:hypothetical protein [Pseudomonas migulae]